MEIQRSFRLAAPFGSAQGRLYQVAAATAPQSRNPVPIASRPHCKHLSRMTPGFGAGLVIPDLWQQEAVRALQHGKDVVVQAPTGSGKTSAIPNLGARPPSQECPRP